MSVAYVLFMRSEVAEFYRSLRQSEMKMVADFFDLRETTERDEAGRTVQVKFVGKLKIVYWADHPVKEIKVLKLERIPKG